MSRKTEWRSRPLPRDWGRTRRRILRRDGGVCYVCHKPGANAVDHIVPVSAGGSEDDSNLASIHERPCHAAKTAQEANARNPKAIPRKRAPEQHPGMIQSVAMNSPSGASKGGAPRKR
jgi:5-methylcytosine-specific restriction endonuclease McrA